MRRILLSLTTVAALTVVSFGGCAPEGPSAYVDANIEPDTECLFAPGSTDSVVQLASGLYDIAVNAGGNNERYCENPYVMALRLNSQLRANMDMELGRAEPNVLQVNEAVITLRDRQGARLVIGSGDGLPNPFRVNTNAAVRPTDNEDPALAVVFVEAIPVPYADFLNDFVDDQILVEVQLVGRTLGDVEFDLAPFTYPVRICRGCRTRCGGQADPVNELLLEELSDSCQDDRGFDNRLCFDPNCAP